MSGPPPAPAPTPLLSDEDAALLAKEDRLTPADKAKRDEVRAQVISEIQSTEKSYVQSLDALSTCFVQPLIERQKSSKTAFSDISPTLVEYLTSNLETLTNFHHTFIGALVLVPAVLPAGIAAAAASPPPPAAAAPAAAGSSSVAPLSIPALFLRYADFFRLYIPYLNGYERSLNTFNDLRKHKKFSEWLNTDVKAALLKHAQACGTNVLDLQSYMIQPVQRVPRYVLLLKELKRQTSPHHPEFASLNQALTAVQKVASVINEGQRAVENMSKLMTVQQRIIGDFDGIIQPHRRLIREGVVTATYTHGVFATMRTRKSVFFLFSDLLLWTGESFKFKGSIDLTPAKLTPRSPTSFTIDTAARVVHVTLDTQQETKSWFEVIDSVVCNLQNEREKLRQRARVQKGRNRGTANKDLVHDLVTQSLQGLALNAEAAPAQGAGEDGAAAAAAGAGSAAASSSAAAAPGAAPSAGTVGRNAAPTLGHRSGRKWAEALDESQAKATKDQQAKDAYAREKVSADMFAPPTEEAAPAPAPAAAAPAGAGAGAGGSTYVPKFVSRRGKSGGTLGKGGCLCTQILIHQACPKHGDEAVAAQAAAEAQAAAAGTAPAQP